MLGRRAVALAIAITALAGGGLPAGAEVRDPSITVVPDTDLVDDQRVLVHGEDFPRQRVFVVGQCDARATDERGCDQSIGLFSESREWTIDFQVERAIDTVFGRVDCASGPGACVIAVLHRPGRILLAEPLHFDPEGPPPDPELRIEIDVVESVRLGPDGRHARVDVVVTCQPGQHAFVDVQLAQDAGEEDAIAFGGEFVRRCRGTTPMSIEVRVFEGAGFGPGDGFVVATAFGFRQGDEEPGDVDSEVAEVTLSG